MKTRIYVGAALAILLLLPSGAISQMSWRILCSDRDSLTECRLDSLKDSVLMITQRGQKKSIPVSSIVEIRQVRDGSFGKGAKLGAEIGAGTGMVIGALAGANAKGGGVGFFSANDSEARAVAIPLGAIVYGALFGCVGGFVGGIAGASSGVDDVYDLSQMPLKGKLAVTQMIMEHNSNPDP